MKRIVMIVVTLSGFLAMAGVLTVERGLAEEQRDDESRIRQGLAIAPVPLNFEGRNRALVGLGSYIVNAQGTCADCHSCPTFAPGHNPFEGGDGQLNAVNYLAGGVDFGFGIIASNITPDADGRPAGLTLEEFTRVLRTGQESDHSGSILQVMPWPVFGKMSDRDIRAIYEYLSSIPHAEPGLCFHPAQ